MKKKGVIMAEASNSLVAARGESIIVMYVGVQDPNQVTITNLSAVQGNFIIRGATSVKGD
jgi:hypothetical protein